MWCVDYFGWLVDGGPESSRWEVYICIERVCRAASGKG